MTTPHLLTPQVIRPLLFEVLRKHPEGQLLDAVGRLGMLALQRGLVKKAPSAPTFGGGAESDLGRPNYERIRGVTQQLMWHLLVQGIIVWGSKDGAGSYPLYWVSEHGSQVLAEGTSPQPYDPDGFLAGFDRLVPNGDPVVRDYLAEAVLAFNSNCFRSSAVMLGCASEKSLLVLLDSFVKAISDPQKKAKFEKDASGISIHKKYRALKDRLDLMAQGKKLSFDHAETVGSQIPAGFELIRRCRNIAGHPELGGSADQDTVFMNLRVFTEFARRVFALNDYFATNPAEW